jgi:2-amino-4-hydroxy-6-hydroxymethyldihydropteridine diphosphokinase
MILLALGANLAGPAGEPRAQVLAALARLPGEGIRVAARSRLWRSPAWPDPGDPEFVNAVARVETALDPAALLAALHRVEAALGRVRGRPNAPRAIDLDLLDVDGLVRVAPPPVLPHPRMAARGFVLRPLAELAPGWRHPADGRGLAELLAALPAKDGVEPLEPQA